MPLVAILKRPILQIPHIDLFLEPWGRPVDFYRLRGQAGELVAIAGWGFKPTAEEARREAAKRGLTYLALEDGFLRSVGLGVAGALPWSLLVDDLGAHYDVSAESRLERTIAQTTSPNETTDELLRLLRAHNLSKYNDAADLAGPLPGEDGRPLVIVVDQTAGDVSVAAGGAGAESFSRMLDAAVAENPDAQVMVRTHPDVIAGRRAGYLCEEARRRGLTLLVHPASWPSIARRVRRVYVVTSLAGLEALVAGVPVTCFGLPFYAGWGLTDDRTACPSRQARPSLGALVAAVYEHYPRYVDQLDGRLSTAVNVARRFASARQTGSARGKGWQRPERGLRDRLIEALAVARTRAARRLWRPG